MLQFSEYDVDLSGDSKLSHHSGSQDPTLLSSHDDEYDVDLSAEHLDSLVQQSISPENDLMYSYHPLKQDNDNVSQSPAKNHHLAPTARFPANDFWMEMVPPEFDPESTYSTESHRQFTKKSLYTDLAVLDGRDPFWRHTQSSKHTKTLLENQQENQTENTVTFARDVPQSPEDSQEPIPAQQMPNLHVIQEQTLFQQQPQQSAASPAIATLSVYDFDFQNPLETMSASEKKEMAALAEIEQQTRNHVQLSRKMFENSWKGVPSHIPTLSSYDADNALVEEAWKSGVATSEWVHPTPRRHQINESSIGSFIFGDENARQNHHVQNQRVFAESWGQVDGIGGSDVPRPMQEQRMFNRAWDFNDPADDIPRMPMPALETQQFHTTKTLKSARSARGSEWVYDPPFATFPGDSELDGDAYTDKQEQENSYGYHPVVKQQPEPEPEESELDSQFEPDESSAPITNVSQTPEIPVLNLSLQDMNSLSISGYSAASPQSQASADMSLTSVDSFASQQDDAQMSKPSQSINSYYRQEYMDPRIYLRQLEEFQQRFNQGDTSTDTVEMDDDISETLSQKDVAQWTEQLYNDNKQTTVNRFKTSSMEYGNLSHLMFVGPRKQMGLARYQLENPWKNDHLIDPENPDEPAILYEKVEEGNTIARHWGRDFKQRQQWFR